MSVYWFIAYSASFYDVPREEGQEPIVMESIPMGAPPIVPIVAIEAKSLGDLKLGFADFVASLPPDKNWSARVLHRTGRKCVGFDKAKFALSKSNRAPVQA